MISYNDFANFNKSNYNFSVCDDWGWFHIDDENHLLQNTIIYMHYTSPQIPQYKPIIKSTHPTTNPFIQTPPNVAQKMHHAHLTIDKVRTSRSYYKNNNCDIVSSFNTIKNALVFGVMLMIYIFSP